MSYTTVEERQREKIIELQARVAELEGARAKAVEGAALEFAIALDSLKWIAEHDGGDAAAMATLAELDRRADVIAAQADELERMRDAMRRVSHVRASWAGTNEALDLELGEALADLDRAATAQAEPQDCGGEGTPR